jgi:hypothetical protein
MHNIHVNDLILHPSNNEIKHRPKISITYEDRNQNQQSPSIPTATISGGARNLV